MARETGSGLATTTNTPPELDPVQFVALGQLGDHRAAVLADISAQRAGAIEVAVGSPHRLARAVARRPLGARQVDRLRQLPRVDHQDRLDPAMVEHDNDLAGQIAPPQPGADALQRLARGTGGDIARGEEGKAGDVPAGIGRDHRLDFELCAIHVADGYVNAPVAALLPVGSHSLRQRTSSNTINSWSTTRSSRTSALPSLRVTGDSPLSTQTRARTASPPCQRTRIVSGPTGRCSSR